jgi:hypothetical protein
MSTTVVPPVASRTARSGRRAVRQRQEGDVDPGLRLALGQSQSERGEMSELGGERLSIAVAPVERIDPTFGWPARRRTSSAPA